MIEFINSLSDNEIQLMGVIAQILAAIGTFTAAFVALHISQRGPSFFLKFALVQATGELDGIPAYTTCICYAARNTGNDVEIVTLFGFSMPFSKTWIFISSNGMPSFPTPLPCTLEPGIEFSAFLPLETFHTAQLGAFKTEAKYLWLSKSLTWLKLQVISFYFVVSRYKKPVKQRLSREMKKHIYSEIFREAQPQSEQPATDSTN